MIAPIKASAGIAALALNDTGATAHPLGETFDVTGRIVVGAKTFVLAERRLGRDFDFKRSKQLLHPHYSCCGLVNFTTEKPKMNRFQCV